MAWFAILFVEPVILGTLLGVGAQNAPFRRLARKVGLRPIHPMPTAWDYRFSSGHGGHLLVRLKNGTKFAGYYSERSHTSSDPSERDVFIEQVYDIADDNQWILRPGKSLLIAGGEISTIEFFEETEST